MMRNKYTVVVILLVVFSILVLSIDLRDSRKIPVLKEYNIHYGDSILKVWSRLKIKPERSEFHPSTGARDFYFYSEVMGIESEICLSFNRTYRLTTVYIYISTVELSESEKQNLIDKIKAFIKEEYETQPLYNCTDWTQYKNELSFSAMRSGAIGEEYSIVIMEQKLKIWCFDCR